MPKTLSKRDVGRLEPRDKSYVLWDPGLQGFGIRVPTTGAKTFVVKVRVGHGRFVEQHWITIGRCGPLSLDKARAEARLIIARAMTGQEPASRRKVSEAEVMTVEDLKKKWLETGALRSRALGRRFGELRDSANVNVDRGRVNACIIPLIGKIKLQEPARRHVAGMRDKIRLGTTTLVIAISNPQPDAIYFGLERPTDLARFDENIHDQICRDTGRGGVQERAKAISGQRS